MKINILLPYKEKFDENKASSVSITVKNNLLHTKFLGNIRVYGQNVENPLFKNNFEGIKYSIFSLKSKNVFLAHQMLKIISKESSEKQLIEIHNRPYLIEQMARNSNFPMTLFLHNDPQTMKGSKSIQDRKNILEKCAAVFCVSEYIRNKFLEGISLSREKVHVLHNGVDKKLKKFPVKKKEVLFVGRLVSEKGVDLYVDVVENIAKNFSDWTFEIIGSLRLGDNKNKDRFAKMIINKFKKISNQAKFHGFKHQDFVQKKMKTAAILVVPSVWEEPFGLVAAEGMSNGISIIASDIGGIPEIVKGNGVLIKHINKQKLEYALVDLINNSSKRKSLQRKSWANFKFTAKKSSRKLDMYREKIFSDTFVHK
ncbi:glycosyltransferase family 4 protein [Alphaproteobacteria bacterium]|nr:glycosyltransferase family 4 protein [Alphaproteobacteria bacterium]